jgi:hypothetical protein
MHHELYESDAGRAPLRTLDTHRICHKLSCWSFSLLRSHLNDSRFDRGGYESAVVALDNITVKYQLVPSAAWAQ